MVMKCSTWMQSQKRQNDLCSFPRQPIQYHPAALLLRQAGQATCTAMKEASGILFALSSIF